MTMLSKREFVIAIAAAALLGLLAVDQMLLRPLLDRREEANMRLFVAREELNRAEQVFENDRRAGRRWVAMAGDSVRSDASAAERQVLNFAWQWAQEAGLSLTGLRPERSEREGDFQRITIRATGAGTMQQVAGFLFAAQEADIPLRVSDLAIMSRREGTDDLSLQIGLSTIYFPSDTFGAGTTEVRP